MIKEFYKRMMLGMAFLLPFAIVFILLREVLKIAKVITAPLLPHLPDFVFGGIGAATLIAAAFIMLLCWGASGLARTASGRRAEAWLEQYMLQYIPGYSIIRSMLYDFAGREDSAKVYPCLARIEDAWQWGVIMDTLTNGLLAVYVPGVPNPGSGSMYFLTEDRVKRVEVPTTKVYQNLRRFGVGARQILEGKI